MFEPAVEGILSDWKTLFQYHMRMHYFGTEKVSIDVLDYYRMFGQKMLQFG